MSIKWDEIKQDVLAQIAGANTKEEIDKLKVDILGKKGLIAGFMSQMKTLSPEEVTSLLNELADEMIRYNFKNTEKASATIQSEISDTETYYYLSEQPNYLIYKTRLIG